MGAVVDDGWQGAGGGGGLLRARARPQANIRKYMAPLKQAQKISDEIFHVQSHTTYTHTFICCLVAHVAVTAFPVAF